MREKTKIVTIGDTNYQFGRLNPALGSFILMKAMGVNVKAARDDESIPQPTKRPEPQQIARSVICAALVGDLSLEDHQLIQRECLKTVSRVEGDNIFMPICTANGAILPDIADDVQLILNLEIEAFVFNFTSFFEQGGLNPTSTRAAV